MSRLVQLPWGDWVDPREVRGIHVRTGGTYVVEIYVVVERDDKPEITSCVDITGAAHATASWVADRMEKARALQNECAAIINSDGDPYRTEGA